MAEINVNFNEVSHENGKMFNYSNDITIIIKITTKLIIIAKHFCLTLSVK